MSHLVRKKNQLTNPIASSCTVLVTFGSRVLRVVYSFKLLHVRPSHGLLAMIAAEIRSRSS